jgi:DNA-directed RNA polymerase specialized sigma24 family protein
MYLEDKDYREIAETLGISEVNARVKMNRIKGKKKILNLSMKELDLLKDWQKNKDSLSKYQK